jgi:hypothetical protein
MKTSSSTSNLLHLLLLLSTLLHLLPSTIAVDPSSLFALCAQGPNEDLADLLAKSDQPYDLLKTRTQDRETCLHLVGIEGDVERLDIVTGVIVKHEATAGNAGGAASLLNAVVDTRTGLDMPALSWLVYGAHEDASLRLMELEGTDVNVVFRNEAGAAKTVLDILKMLYSNVHEGEEFKAAATQAGGGGDGEMGGDKYWKIGMAIVGRGGVTADEVKLGFGESGR